MNVWSFISLQSSSISFLWLILSKKPFISPSMAQLIPFQCEIYLRLRAEWVLLFGLNPKESSDNCGS
jgi:hypothetical protein